MAKMIEVECSKCDGSGIIAHLVHVAGGTCFRCKGSGSFEIPEWKYKKDLEEAARLEQQQRKEMEKEYGPMKENIKKAFSIHEIFPQGVVNGSEEYGGKDTYYVFDKPMNTYFKLEVYENERAYLSYDRDIEQDSELVWTAEDGIL